MNLPQDLRELKTRLLDMLRSRTEREPPVGQQNSAALNMAEQLKNCLERDKLSGASELARSLIIELETIQTVEELPVLSPDGSQCLEQCSFMCALRCQRPLPKDMAVSVKTKYK